MPGWRCGRCGRRFARTRQAHSCRVRSVVDHFRGRDPRLKALFDTLVRRLAKTGPIRVDAVESSIHLASLYHFAGIAVRRGYLRAGFAADRRVDDRRIERIERIGPRRWVHRLAIRSMADLDDELVGWFAMAQALANRARPAAP